MQLTKIYNSIFKNHKQTKDSSLKTIINLDRPQSPKNITNKITNAQAPENRKLRIVKGGLQASALTKSSSAALSCAFSSPILPVKYKLIKRNPKN